MEYSLKAKKYQLTHQGISDKMDFEKENYFLNVKEYQILFYKKEKIFRIDRVLVQVFFQETEASIGTG